MKEIDYAQYRTDTFRYYSQFAPIRAMKRETGRAPYAPGTDCSSSLLWFPEPISTLPDNILRT